MTDKPTHRQIETITNMVALYTAGDRNAHSVVTIETVGELTGVYVMPGEMNRQQASKAITALMNIRNGKSKGRVYHKSNAIVDDYKARLQEFKENRDGGSA